MSINLNSASSSMRIMRTHNQKSYGVRTANILQEKGCIALVTSSYSLIISIAIMQRGDRMDDLISRQAAIDICRAPHMRNADCSDFEMAIMMLPPVQPEQPEPKRGEWLERDVIDEPKGKHITQWQSARCSVCGRYHTTPYLYSFTHYNFCPNCGARMEVTE